MESRVTYGVCSAKFVPNHIVSAVYHLCRTVQCLQFEVCVVQYLLCKVCVVQYLQFKVCLELYSVCSVTSV